MGVRTQVSRSPVLLLLCGMGVGVLSDWLALSRPEAKRCLHALCLLKGAGDGHLVTCRLLSVNDQTEAQERGVGWGMIL